MGLLLLVYYATATDITVVKVMHTKVIFTGDLNVEIAFKRNHHPLYKE